LINQSAGQKCPPPLKHQHEFTTFWMRTNYLGQPEGAGRGVLLTYYPAKSKDLKEVVDFMDQVFLSERNLLGRPHKFCFGVTGSRKPALLEGIDEKPYQRQGGEEDTQDYP
jgi:hypothetical protein